MNQMNDIQALLAMMEDADRDIRARGAEKSGQLGKDAPEAIAEKLLQLLNDGEEDEEVQGAAFEAAEAIGISLFDDELESMTRAIMSKAINRHLGDEEMERYCAHEVGETEGLVLEKHLDRCRICRGKLELMAVMLGEVDDETQQEENRQVLINMLLAGLVAAWAERNNQSKGIRVSIKSERYTGRSAISEDERGQSDDGRIKWYIARKPTGELKITFSSHYEELDGVKFRFCYGKEKRKVHLKLRQEGLVTAVVRFTREEREKIPEGAVSALEIWEEDGDIE